MLLTPLKGRKVHLEKRRRRNAAAEVPVTSWEDSGGGKAGDAYLSKPSVPRHPGRSRAALLCSPTCRGPARILQKRNALPFSLLILVMAYPVFIVLRDGAHSSAELAAELAAGAPGSRMSCLQGPQPEKFCIITLSNLALKQR